MKKMMETVQSEITNKGQMTNKNDEKRRSNVKKGNSIKINCNKCDNNETGDYNYKSDTNGNENNNFLLELPNNFNSFEELANSIQGSSNIVNVKTLCSNESVSYKYNSYIINKL
jgi:hypothetical protein